MVWESLFTSVIFITMEFSRQTYKYFRNRRDHVEELEDISYDDMICAELLLIDDK